MDFHEAANIFPLDEEHIAELAKDIKKHGLLTPIETLKGKIIDGRRRFLACKKAKVKPDFVDVTSLVEDPISYVLSGNLHRRHLTVSQAAMCAQRARAMYDKAAKERQREHGKTAPGKPKNTCDQKSTSVSGKARDDVGKAFGVSGPSVARAKQVQQHGIPEVVEAVDRGEVTVTTASSIAAQPTELQKPLLDAALQKRQQKSPKAKPGKSNGKAKPAGEFQGVGVIRANEAINCLKRIPKKDALRKRGFQIVTDWIKHNR